MGFFSKEKKEEENIKAAVLNQTPSNQPNLPSLPELPDSHDFPTLPELPDYSIPKAIEKDERRAIEIPAPLERSQLTSSMNPSLYSSTSLPLPSLTSTPQTPFQSTSLPSHSSAYNQKEPLFIKIEKFQEAIKKFEEIKQKIAEIETSLNQIKEIKNKEGQEINDWENEIRSIKERVRSIDSSLFDKV